MPVERPTAAIFAGCLIMVTPVVAEESPSAELLEFLGSFETAKGDWIDPTRLPTPAPAPADVPGSAKEKSDEQR